MNSTQSHGRKELMYLHAGVHERDMKALMRSDQPRPRWRRVYAVW